MFGFIRSAYASIKGAIKSAYTKIRNFFFGAPVRISEAPRSRDALSSYIEPLIVPMPSKPTNHLNKNGVPSPFSPEVKRLTERYLSKPSEPCIPIVSAKDLLNPQELCAVETMSALTRHTPELPTPIAVDDPPPETNMILAPLKASVAVCDNLGAMLDQAINDGTPQQAFNCAVESAAGLFWSTFGTPANKKPQDEPSKPRKTGSWLLGV